VQTYPRAGAPGRDETWKSLPAATPVTAPGWCRCPDHPRRPERQLGIQGQLALGSRHRLRLEPHHALTSTARALSRRLCPGPVELPAPRPDGRATVTSPHSNQDHERGHRRSRYPPTGPHEWHAVTGTSHDQLDKDHRHNAADRAMQACERHDADRTPVPHHPRRAKRLLVGAPDAASQQTGTSNTAAHRRNAAGLSRDGPVRRRGRHRGARAATPW